MRRDPLASFRGLVMKGGECDTDLDVLASEYRGQDIWPLADSLSPTAKED